jgi:hypothetical protein
MRHRISNADVTTATYYSASGGTDTTTNFAATGTYNATYMQLGTNIGQNSGWGMNFDLTLICEHTAGKWVGGGQELAMKVRPLFRLLIPLALQNKLFLPRSSAMRELHFCSNLLARYQRSAKKEII